MYMLTICGKVGNIMKDTFKTKLKDKFLVGLLQSQNIMVYLWKEKVNFVVRVCEESVPDVVENSWFFGVEHIRDGHRAVKQLRLE